MLHFFSERSERNAAGACTPEALAARRRAKWGAVPAAHCTDLEEMRVRGCSDADSRHTRLDAECACVSVANIIRFSKAHFADKLPEGSALISL